MTPNWAGGLDKVSGSEQSRALELPDPSIEAKRHLGWPALQAQLGSRLLTDLAKSRAQASHDSGLAADVDGASRRLAELDGLEWLLRADGDAPSTSADGSWAGRLAASLGQLEDLDESLEVARSGGQLSVVELVGVRESLAAAAAADGLARVADPGENDTPTVHAGVATLRASLARLEPDPPLLATLERAIDRDPSSGEPRLADAASPELASARRAATDRRQRLVKRAESLLRRPEYAGALMDDFWTEREGRVVLPFRSGGLGAVRSGIIHASSGTGQTTYVEPAELVEDNNGVREAQMRVATEERRILAELSRRVGSGATLLAANQRALIELDRVRARLLLSDAIGGLRPELEEPDVGAQLSLPGARHPLMLLDGVEVVPNDLAVGRGQALVITGPNAGGKTVALKTIGLCVLMARAGLRLPTERPARVPLYRHIVTDVGDDQSIAANLSTFSAHIGHLRQAVADAESDGAATLVLLDEIAVGTDPEQGAALAESILLHLVRHGATVVVTTHYERLKLLASQPDTASMFENAAVGFDVANMRPTFRISLGMPGASSALVVARRLGLSAAVLDHAQSLLSDERLEVDVLLREIEAERVRLAQARERLDEETRRLARTRGEVERREKRALEGAKSRKAKALDAATDELRALEGELKIRRKQLRKHGADSLPERDAYVGDARVRIEDHRDAERPDGRAPARLEVGQRVELPTLGQSGEVVTIKGDRVTVQLAKLRTTVGREEVRASADPPRGELRDESGRARPTTRRRSAEPIYSFGSDAPKHFGADAKPVDPGIDDTIDVRGTRIEDLADALEPALADAIARDRDVVVVKHGHGSGQLRKAVRDQLARLTYVRRHRPGLPPEGGDAVTVVWIEA